MFHQLWVLLCLLTSGHSVEMIISTAQDIFFLHQSSKITTKAFSDSILALNSDGMSHVFILQKNNNAGNGNQLKLTNLTSFSSPEDQNQHQESIFFPVIPGVNQILPYHNNGFFMSNQTHLFLFKDQELQLIYQGLKIDDVTLDFCNDLLILIDSGILTQAKIVTSTETKLNFEKWTKNEIETEAEMISSHSNTLVYTTKNSQIWHSDGFVLKSRDGSIICSSDPDASYNVRDIQVFEKSVYMLDAHNLVLWKLDLKDATPTVDDKKICRLVIWKHLEGLRQPRDLALLNSVQECISTSTVLDSTLTTSISSQNVEYNSIEEKQTKENKNSSADPCLNYCYHGSCYLTSFGVPICNCNFNFSGSRCETNICHNYCLNNGLCHISNSGMQSCLCPKGYFGSRCNLTSDWNYYLAFVCMSGVNCGLFMILLVLICLYCHKKKLMEKNNEEPEIFKKNYGKKSINSQIRSKKSNNNKEFLPVDANNVDDKCFDSKGHSCQALIGDDGVVLDLEDCCQMTICEKPCIEAKFRKPSHRKKTKLDTRNLLADSDDIY